MGRWKIWKLRLEKWFVCRSRSRQCKLNPAEHDANSRVNSFNSRGKQSTLALLAQKWSSPLSFYIYLSALRSFFLPFSRWYWERAENWVGRTTVSILCYDRAASERGNYIFRPWTLDQFALAELRENILDLRISRLTATHGGRGYPYVTCYLRHVAMIITRPRILGLSNPWKSASNLRCYLLTAWRS